MTVEKEMKPVKVGKVEIMFFDDGSTEFDYIEFVQTPHSKRKQPWRLSKTEFLKAMKNIVGDLVENTFSMLSGKSGTYLEAKVPEQADES